MTAETDSDTAPAASAPVEDSAAETAPPRESTANPMRPIERRAARDLARQRIEESKERLGEQPAPV